MKSAISALVLFSSLFAISGCATMFGSSTDEITLNSEPEGADVYYRDANIGKTPLRYRFKRRTDSTSVTFKKDGYDDKRVNLAHNIAPVSFWNLGFITTTFGVSSWGTDVSTGKMWEYSPDAYAVQLEKSDAGTWNGSVFDFVLVGGENLKLDLARHGGETLSTFCHLVQKSSAQCQTFASNALKAQVLSSRNNLELYRNLHQVEIQ